MSERRQASQNRMLHILYILEIQAPVKKEAGMPRGLLQAERHPGGGRRGAPDSGAPPDGAGTGITCALCWTAFSGILPKGITSRGTCRPAPTTLRGPWRTAMQWRLEVACGLNWAPHRVQKLVKGKHPQYSAPLWSFAACGRSGSWKLSLALRHLHFSS